MKKLTKIFSVLASLALLGAGFSSCSGDEETVIVKPSYKSSKTITVTGHKSDKIKYGNTEQLAALVLPEDEAVTWHTSDESIVSVSETGLVTAEDVSDAKVQVWAEISDGTKSNEVNYLVMQEIPKITGISLVSAPAKEKYATGTFVNLSGLKIAVEYDVPVGSVFAADYPAELEFTSENSSQFAVSGFDSSAAASGQTVTVTYNPVDTAGDAVEFVDGAVKTVTFDVDILSASVTSVTVNSEKSKTEYLYSNVLEPLDVSLDIAYSASELDETISALTNGVTMTVNGYDFDWSMVDASWFVTWTQEHKIGTSITFTYGGVSTSSPLDITFDAVLAESLSISALSSTLEQGSALQFTASVLPENATVNAMTQKVVWSVEAGETGVTIDSATGLLSAESALASGTVKVKARANDTSGTVSAEKEIMIPVWLKGIEVTAAPAKTEYLKGTNLNTAGMTVNELYSDGTSVETTAYTVDTTTLNTAGNAVAVTVTSTADTTKTAAFNVKVIETYENKVKLDYGSSELWSAAYPYSKVITGGSSAAKATIDGTETDFEAYLCKHFWLQKGANVNHRTDKSAFFLNRTASTGDGAVTGQSPVMLAAEVAGKYRIEADIFATADKAANTSRKIYIKTLEEETASADGETTKLTVDSGAFTTVVDTTQSSATKHTISYEYMGDSSYSIVALDMGEGDAVYIAEIRLYTTGAALAEPVISLEVKSVTVTDSEGSEIATNTTAGSLSLKKTAFPLTITGTYAPSAAAATVSYSLADADGLASGVAGKVHIDSATGEITLDNDISGEYSGTITVTAGEVSATITLAIDAGAALLESSDTVTVTSSAKKVGTNETATLTAELSVNPESLDETVTYQWYTSATEDGDYTAIGGATASTYAYSSETEGAAYFKCVVTGGTSGVEVTSEAVKVTVSNSNDAVVCVFTGKTPSSNVFTVSGNYATDKGEVTVDGVTYSTCLKMESSTSISFTTTDEKTLKLVFLSTQTGKKVKINGTAYTTDSSGIVEMTLAAGTHTITKGDSIYLYYISLTD